MDRGDGGPGRIYFGGGKGRVAPSSEPERLTGPDNAGERRPPTGTAGAPGGPASHQCPATDIHAPWAPTDGWIRQAGAAEAFCREVARR